jgi:hypothetical protein
MRTWKLMLLVIAECVVVMTTHAADAPVHTSICEIAKEPQKFDGKMVRLAAVVKTGFEQSTLEDPRDKECEAPWFTYPGGSPTTSMSVVVGRRKSYPLVVLREDHRFSDFSEHLGAQMYPRVESHICMDCPRYQVTATMTGMIEVAGKGRFAGFGHLNMYNTQFVLQSVQSFTATDHIDTYDPKEYSTSPIHFPKASIRGIVLNPEGDPAEDAPVSAYRLAYPGKYVLAGAGASDDGGNFRLLLTPGTYRLGVNTSEPASGRAPFVATYYPSAPNDADARDITIVDGEEKSGVEIRASARIPTKTIPVKVIWPDGRPVEKAEVWLAPASDPDKVVGGPKEHTAADGTEWLDGVEGVDYVIGTGQDTGGGVTSCADIVLVPSAVAVTSPIVLKLDVSLSHGCWQRTRKPDVVYAPPRS